MSVHKTIDHRPGMRSADKRQEEKDFSEWETVSKRLRWDV